MRRLIMLALVLILGAFFAVATAAAMTEEEFIRYLIENKWFGF